MSNSEAVYGGGQDYFNPSSYSSISSPYSMFGDLASSQDARTANQVKETSKNLNTGLKTFEVAGHSPEVFEAMPQEQLQEINRLAKITGSEPTFHAPMIDPTGIVQDRWDEETRKSAERQLWSAVERSHDLNPTGNVNVTFHATTAGLPGAEQWVKEGDEKKLKSFLFVGPQGKINQIKDQEKFFPREGGNKIFDAEKELARENKEVWTKQLGDLNFYTDRGLQGAQFVEYLNAHGGDLEDYKRHWEETRELQEKSGISQREQEKLHSPQEIKRQILHGTNYLRDAYRNLQGLYDLAYERGSPEERQKLDAYAKTLEPHLKDFDNIEQNPDKLTEFADAIETGVDVLSKVNPQIFKPMREFAIDKSSETISNIALKAYGEFGSTAPILSIENHPAGQSILTTGSDIRDVVEEARKKFKEKLIKENHLSSSEAGRQAKKLIGATWDVGHINMLRKFGFDKDDLIKETEKVAPVVNKVHLSDNFGFEHTELPMGMGNVPIKEIMGKLNKEGFKGKKIAEALSWWQHFSGEGHAITPTMQGMGSPIYGMQNAPYWNQVVGNEGAYFSGMGPINPGTHHSVYGSGFTTLPRELGGEISGDRSRFSGTPNA